ncbi:programmed cell death protein 2-like [Sycon ciliatum]|uniref:programmed cell death protein 2-like n=1 Tax=Sycon ciliatum TaxID=27933 RepID=UPI0031F66424
MSTWLGLCGERITDTVDGYWCNKLGGSPNWITGISAEYGHCPVCSNNSMELVVQLYAPLESSVYHRTLYILACGGKCRGRPSSWRVLRCQSVDESSNGETTSCLESNLDTAAPTASLDNGADDWGVDQDDWGDSGGGDTFDFSSPVNPMAAPRTTARATCAQPTQHFTRNGQSSEAAPVATVATSAWTSENSFVSYYIDVMEEPVVDKKSQNFSHELELLAQYEETEGVSLKSLSSGKSSSSASAAGGGGNEEYEKSKAKHGDDAFRKFHKILARNAAQCLRYRWLLTPLEFTDSQPLPQEVQCSHCGARAHAEVQLMPPALAHLSSEGSRSSLARTAAAAECSAGSRLEFGTVVVYTCSESCWSDSCTVRTERCVVLLDPDQEKLDFLIRKTDQNQCPVSNTQKT